jgi:hypothetical protein
MTAATTKMRKRPAITPSGRRRYARANRKRAGRREIR